MEPYNLSSDHSLNLCEKIPQEQSKTFTPGESSRFPFISIMPQESVNKDSSPQSPEILSPFRKKTFNKKRASNNIFFGAKSKYSKKQRSCTLEISKSPKVSGFQTSFNVKRTINKFLNIWRKSRFFSSIENLKKYHLDIINDKSVVLSQKNQSSEKRSILNEWELILKSSRITTLVSKANTRKLKLIVQAIRRFLPAFDPNHYSKMVWDFMMVLVISTILIIHTLELGFEVQFKRENDYRIFHFLFSFVLYLDVFISLNTIYYKDGVQIKDRYMMVSQYFKGKMFADIIACVSTSINYYVKIENQWLDLDPLILFKLMKYSDFESRFKASFINNVKTESIYKILGLILKIFLAAHLLACVWHYIGHSNMEYNSQEPNWLKVKGIHIEPVITRYIYSFYWGITTMLTVGYGDITPSNRGEVLFNIWAMLIGCGLFGYSMNYIGDILRIASRREGFLKEQIAQVRKILKRKNLPKELQTRITKYLEFIWERELSEDPEEENNMMNKLSSKLRDEVYLHTNVKYLKQVRAFRILSERTLITLASFMRKIRFSPEEYVYKSGEMEDFSLYFIIDGTMERVSEKDLSKTHNFIKWAMLKKGDYFGLHELLTGSTRQSSILSIEFSSLFQLTRNDFLNVLRSFPEDYEKFCKLRDDVILNGELRFLDLKCPSCLMNDHKIEGCKFFRYAPNTLSVIGRYLFEKKKSDRRFQRKKERMGNTLYKKARYQTGAADFMYAYKDDEDIEALQDIYRQDQHLDYDRRDLKFPHVEDSESPCFSDHLNTDSPHSNCFQIKEPTEIKIDLQPKKSPTSKMQDGNFIFPPSVGREFKKQTLIKSSPPSLSTEIKNHIIKIPTIRDDKPIKPIMELSSDMDLIKSYKHYYPHMNIENFIKIYNKKRRRYVRSRKLIL